MADKAASMRQALTRIAREAREILGNYVSDDSRNTTQETTSSLVQSRLPFSNSGNSVVAELNRAFPSRWPGTKSKTARRDSPQTSKVKCKGRRGPQIVYKDVVLLPTKDCQSVPTHQVRFNLECNGFVVHAFPVDKEWNEQNLRMKLIDLFPAISDIEFDFVKTCYGQIIMPKLAAGVEYSAARVLAISGQGAVYIRPKEDLVSSKYQNYDSNTDEDEKDESSSKRLKRDSQQSVSQQNLVFDQQPSCSSSSLHHTDALAEMFPTTPFADLQKALQEHASIEGAALALSTKDPTSINLDDALSEDDEILEIPALDGGKVTLNGILKRLSSEMCIEKEKIKVEEDDIISDALCYYKDPEFNPRKRLRVLFKGQPAADTGGVMRQFFSILLQKLVESFFEGGHYKLPIYNPDIVSSSIMKYIGIIVVHSIVQGGPGFPIFSSGVYKYLVTGDIGTSMDEVTIEDCSPATKHVVSQIVETVNLEGLSEDIHNTILDSGMTIALNENNKWRIVNGIMLHDVFAKRKIVFDQFKTGLNTLGFLEKMREQSMLFKELFVLEDTLHAEDILKILSKDANLTEDEEKIWGYMTNYLNEATCDTLKQFLVYCTGSPLLPNFGLSCIKVKFDAVDSIFASTCLLSITFPNNISNETSFKVLFSACICKEKSKSFNCI